MRAAKGRRVSEEEFWATFHANHGLLLGAFLDAVSGALGHKDSVVLADKPRMADFAIWVTAAEPACGWSYGSFMAAYTDNLMTSIETTQSNSAASKGSDPSERS